MIKLTEQQIIDQMATRPAGVYQEVEPTRVTRVIREEYARFDGRPIRDYIPLFVERNAKTELAKLGA